jgi:hypothetical protein
MALSKQRQTEIMRLVHEGGDELTHAISLGERETEKHLEAIHREISDFLKTCQDKDELDFFAENWTRDGREGPIHQLIQNPHVDAGTLLRIYWYSDPEYYFEECASSEEGPAYEQDVVKTLETIERRFLKSEFKTSSIPFDPAPHVTMQDRHAEFARPIPPIMLQPIPGRK